ncbi:hypothetical protein [Amycolatopsis thermophila]|uniref:Uncharacterized protein n=1 Tax=Amycolatopsis thermophila TaxID=206084 RepID=A0ABU0EW34_9PSEU|nr:hypothetical protein [Amycolatopsis thermophila]MDQ0379483.1 hypothetical protein [Amycolatopsis thermophila]
MTADDNAVTRQSREDATELEALRQENALLRRRAARLERDLASVAPLVEQVKHLSFWDFAPYGVAPDESWVAVDRGKATAVMGALARIDHWNPWSTTIEPRPQP